MWVKPHELLLKSALWDTDETTFYFVLQRRKGHGKSKGLSSFLVGTLDSVLDSKPAPYRILHQTPNSEIYYVVATALTEQEIKQDWQWLFDNVCPTLHSFEKEEEVTEFVCCKINSIIATEQENFTEDEDTITYKNVDYEFHQRFGMPKDEKLVCYYSCSFGWMHLFVNIKLIMATNSYKVESGLQLLARLTKKKVIQNFYPMLFEVAPKLGEVIEILGESNSGKSFLLMDMIAEALIPSELDGAEIATLVFNTDGNFNPDILINLLKDKILKRQNAQSSAAGSNDVLQECLGRLHYVEIHDATQFYITIQNLETILFDNPTISLFAFDTLTAYYWSEQGYKLTKMDIYVKNIVKLIHKAAYEHKSTIIYTKPLYFNTSKDVVDIPEHLNHRIQLCSKIDANYKEDISYEALCTSGLQVRKTFNITNNKLMWR